MRTLVGGRLERFDQFLKILGIAQKAERDPQDCIFWDSCKRQKVIPKDVLEEKCGQTIQSKSIE